MITVVSGLPRSGTSLLMQMLAAGGHSILSDNLRPADINNPRGYLEYAKVRTLERDATWVPEAEGKVVKIISFLLNKLPSTHSYKVIFMRRDLAQVVRSQELMLQNSGLPPGTASEIMIQHFDRHLKQLDLWLPQQQHLDVLNCDYADLIRDTDEQSMRVQKFLDIELDVRKMAEAVCPELHRQKNGSGNHS